MFPSLWPTTWARQNPVVSETDEHHTHLLQIPTPEVGQIQKVALGMCNQISNGTDVSLIQAVLGSCREPSVFLDARKQGLWRKFLKGHQPSPFRDTLIE